MLTISNWCWKCLLVLTMSNWCWSGLTVSAHWLAFACVYKNNDRSAVKLLYRIDCWWSIILVFVSYVIVIVIVIVIAVSQFLRLLYIMIFPANYTWHNDSTVMSASLSLSNRETSTYKRKQLRMLSIVGKINK